MFHKPKNFDVHSRTFKIQPIQIDTIYQSPIFFQIIRFSSAAMHCTQAIAVYKLLQYRGLCFIYLHIQN